jgi:hypothetical protein
MMMPARTGSMTPFTIIHSDFSESSRRWAIATAIIRMPSAMKKAVSARVEVITGAATLAARPHASLDHRQLRETRPVN